MPNVNVVRPDGSTASVPAESVEALERLGYRREVFEEGRERAGRELTEDYYDTADQKAAAFGEGLLSGVTLGGAELLLDDVESREREEYLPGWKIAGEVTGAVGSAVLTGGSGAVGSAARATPAGLALRAGESVAGKVAKSSLGKAAVSGAVEGAISGGAMTAANVLTDNRPDTVESFMGEVGLATLFSAGAGGVLGGVIEGGTQLGKGAAERLLKRSGAHHDLPKLGGLETELDSFKGIPGALDEADKVLAREADQLRVELKAGREQLELLEQKFDSGINYTDEIEKVQARRAAGELTDEQADSLIRKYGNRMVGEEPEPVFHAPVTPSDELLAKVAADRAGPGPGTNAGTPRARAAAEPAPEIDPVTGRTRHGVGVDRDPRLTKVLSRQAEAPRPGTIPFKRGATRAGVDAPESPPARLNTPGGRADTGTLDTNPGKRTPPANLRNDPVPGGPDPMAEPAGRPSTGTMADYDAMVALDADLAKKSGREGQLWFKQKHLNDARELLSNPDVLHRLTPENLAFSLDNIKRALDGTEAWKAVNDAYAKALENKGVDLTGIKPADIAELAGIKPEVFETFDDADVPILAGWARMGGPDAPRGPYPYKKGSKPKKDRHEDRLEQFAGKALRYLGGKVARKVTGGGFGSYILGWQAMDAAWQGRLGAFLQGAHRNALNTIDGSLAKLKHLTKAQRAVSGVGPLVAMTARDYEESSKQVHTLAGAGGRESLYASTARLRQFDPVLADRMVEDGLRRAKYLSGVLPKPPPQALFRDTKWIPSDVDRAKLAGVVRAVEEPTFAVQQLAVGRLTPQVAAAFRETSPALFAQVAEKLIDFANSATDASPLAKRQVSIMLGVPADSLQLYTAQLQARFSAPNPEPAPAVSAKNTTSFNQPTQAQELTER